MALHLVLASASPRRADLLRAAGFAFDVLTVDVDETPRADEPPRDLVRRLAAEKSAAAVRKLGPAHADAVVLAADTVVVVDDAILNKPASPDEAAGMLRRLSGRHHQVLTGISLRRNGFELGRVETTTVEFSRLSEADIAWYVASGEGLDKAGGYGIQGLASRFVPRIEGSYSNVVGLPVGAVFELLGEIASGWQSGYSDR